MSTYDLKSVKLPVLTGTGLRVFASGLESGLTRGLLLGKILQDAGIQGLRGKHLHGPPTFLPLSEPKERAVAADSPPSLGATLEGERANPAYSARDFRDAYRKGTLSPIDVAERVLSAIAESESGSQPLRAIIAHDREDLLAQAEESTKRIASGEARGPLEGVPIAIKDELDMRPFPTTVGTAFLGASPAAEDSTVVRRLREQGALLIGKANMHEIGINPNGYNKHFGVARNPHALGYDTGGSSSGSAAAVAAGLCPIAIGADGGGSIRIPAGLCGAVGLKATYGRISEHGAAPLCWSVAHVGPIASTVEDLVLGYQAIAGPDVHDSSSSHQGPLSIAGWDAEDLKGVRIGIFRPWFEHATEEIVSACTELSTKLEGAGATLREIEIPGLDDMRVAHAITILSEMAAAMQCYPEHALEFSPTVRVNLALGRAMSSGDYLQAQKIRTIAMATFARVFEEVDVVLTPTTATTAPAIREDELEIGWSDLSATTEIMRYAIPGNLVGLPAISFPAGYGANGLPIGMQAMGRHWDEALLLRIAHVAEGLVERKRAGTYFDLLAG
ncbi:MAG: amidase [Myxococcales bacterium]|nr:amidase [Myxococcales bacterium]